MEIGFTPVYFLQNLFKVAKHIMVNFTILCLYNLSSPETPVSNSGLKASNSSNSGHTDQHGCSLGWTWGWQYWSGIPHQEVIHWRSHAYAQPQLSKSWVPEFEVIVSGQPQYEPQQQRGRQHGDCWGRGDETRQEDFGDGQPLGVSHHQNILE